MEVVKDKDLKVEGKNGDLPADSPKYVVEKGYIHEFAPAKDGIEINPKPTTDPLDPLNFSQSRKFTCLGIVMWMCKKSIFLRRYQVRIC
jgi:hypothetical protein